MFSFLTEDICIDFRYWVQMKCTLYPIVPYIRVTYIRHLMYVDSEHLSNRNKRRVWQVLRLQNAVCRIEFRMEVSQEDSLQIRSALNICCGLVAITVGIGMWSVQFEKGINWYPILWWKLLSLARMWSIYEPKYVDWYSIPWWKAWSLAIFSFNLDSTFPPTSLIYVFKR